MGCGYAWRSKPKEHDRKGYLRKNGFVKPTIVNKGISKSERVDSKWSNLKDPDDFDKRDYWKDVEPKELRGNWSNKKKALWFSRKSNEELKKKRPDYRLVRYYNSQARMYNDE